MPTLVSTKITARNGHSAASVKRAVDVIAIGDKFRYTLHYVVSYEFATSTEAAAHSSLFVQEISLNPARR